MTRIQPDPLTRRSMLGGAAVVGLGSPVLAACGGGSQAQQQEGEEEAPAGPTIRCACHGSSFSAVDGSVVGGPATSALSAKPVAVQGEDIEVGGKVIGSKADVPEGGGTVFREQEVVVTQPDSGDFKAFTAVCTHQGCLVDRVEPA